MKLSVNLEYCYGIKKLEHTFDFTKSKTFSIYAPNGSMKTSFTKTFEDYCAKRDSKDVIFPDRSTVRVIKDDTTDLQPDAIFVVKPYDKDYASEKTSTLLVNKVLRKKHEEIWQNIQNLENDLLKSLKKPSGLSKDIDKVVSEAFTGNTEDFLKTIQRVNEEVNDGKEPVFSSVSYKIIFNDKVLKVLGEIQPELNNYITRYNELISKSKYFQQGVFNHTNALVISKTLVKNGFFDASHSVAMSDGRVIKSESDLQNVIEDELNEILEDEKLRKNFDAIDKKLSSPDDLVKFREYITEHQELLVELSNLNNFKQKIWIDYFKVCLKEFNTLYEAYSLAKTELDEIRKQANDENTRWKEVVKLFNDRFTVPFTLSVGNQSDVILNETVPTLNYTFEDGADSNPVEKNSLVDTLSTGEQKALYILEILFEVEARVDLKQKTLIIVDDIADSFDYKNKYAIIEYLRDISAKDNFHQIILTHNFDFFRTVESRFQLYQYCLTANKNADGVKLVPIEEQHIKNPFEYFFKNTNDNAKLLALIPFVRNIVEYKEPKDEFNILTSTLHIKSDTANIAVKDIKTIIGTVFGRTISVSDENKNVADLYIETADSFVSKDDPLGLEKKIVLSVAIRLKAEKFMISVIKDDAFVNSIKKYQTTALAERYASVSGVKQEDVDVIKKVNLITPQNIHINSFMYEPILDMSDVELRDLYEEVGLLGSK